jgi:ferredoxin
MRLMLCRTKVEEEEEPEEEEEEEEVWRDWKEEE